jgi:dihydroorotate dehydrogenase (fumarate)
MDLATNYMGLALRNPLVASPSPLSYTLDGIRRLADGGVGAVVMFSLFEEQLRERAARDARLIDDPSESFPEALGYFPSVVEEDSGPHGYLALLERAASAVDIPVIGSLNGITPEGWTEYARAMQNAGAAAIELNIYYLPGTAEISGREVEQRHIEVLERVKAEVSVPVAVKLSPYFSSTAEIALRLEEAGADGLVLFNRFLQPDVDSERLALAPGVGLSTPADARLPRTCIALLRGRVNLSLAATGGVEGRADIANWPPCPILTSAKLRGRWPGRGAVRDALVGRTGEDITASSSATAARIRIPCSTRRPVIVIQAPRPVKGSEYLIRDVTANRMPNL